MSDAAAMEQVVAGVDNSTTAVNSLRWASDFTRSTDTDLRVVHAWQTPTVSYPPDYLVSPITAHMVKVAAEDFVAELLAEEGLDAAKLTVPMGSPRTVLADETTPENLVVVGRTGQGLGAAIVRYLSGALGSTARYVVHHADGPVAVVPSEAKWNESGRAVVGVDGSAASLKALMWAINTLPGTVSIEAAHFVKPWAYDDLVPVDADLQPIIVEAAESQLLSWVAQASEASQRPNREITQRVSVGDSSWGLGSDTDQVDLVVVGHRDRSELAHLLLGSTTDHLLRHSSATVVAIPDRPRQAND